MENEVGGSYFLQFLCHDPTSTAVGLEEEGRGCWYTFQEPSKQPCFATSASSHECPLRQFFQTGFFDTTQRIPGLLQGEEWKVYAIQFLCNPVLSYTGTARPTSLCCIQGKLGSTQEPPCGKGMCVPLPQRRLQFPLWDPQIWACNIADAEPETAHGPNRHTSGEAQLALAHRHIYDCALNNSYHSVLT